MKIVETVIDFARLPSEEKHLLFQQVRAFDQQIFPNAAREQLQQYVYDKEQFLSQLCSTVMRVS